MSNIVEIDGTNSRCWGCGAPATQMLRAPVYFATPACDECAAQWAETRLDSDVQLGDESKVPLDKLFDTPQS